RLVVVADRDLLRERAHSLQLPLKIADYGSGWNHHEAGTLQVLHIPLARRAFPGKLDSANSGYVIKTLERAVEGCEAGEFDALVTAPVHKAIINDAGIAFSGHTEFFAALARCNVAMLLAAPQLRVALATTHLPLADVPAAITAAGLVQILRIVYNDLRSRFRIEIPRIAVLGLNPHAGEGGHLGHEEIEVIAPALAALRAEGMHLEGPLSADTAFLPARRAQTDAFLAMYHDQGLPVLKALGFGDAVNVTLGLPFVRTSVDHGTALDLAGSGKADAASLIAASKMAIELVAAS